MKVLVTGGCGFLGSHLVKRLKERGDTVRVMGHAVMGHAVMGHAGGEHSRSNGNALGDEVVWGDIRDLDFMNRAVAGMDVVVHTASNFRRGGSDRAEAYSINVQGTQNVLEACLNQGVKKLIHCSTIGVHGNVQEIPANEKTDFNPGDVYQETKLAGERCVWDFHYETGLPVSVIRPISMLGPGDTRMLKLFSMIKKRYFVMIGDGETYFQPAYIDDVVNGFMLAIDRDEAIGQTFIIGGEEYVPLKDLVRLIAEELKVPPPRLKLPVGPVLALANLTETFFSPLGLEPPLFKRRVSFFQNNRAFSIRKARETLGYEPKVSLREGIRRTIAWYEAQGWL